MKKIAIIFGGMSTENEVSVKSAKGILENIDKKKYEIYPIYIDKNGTWNECGLNIESSNNKEIENIVKYIKNIDVVIPVLHGLYGEDGTIQGFLELLKIPYVGCNVLASSVGMDKVYSKIIFEKAGLKQAKFIYIKKIKQEYTYVENNFEEQKMNIKDICSKICENIKFPMFIKPSNSGSSIGVNKAEDMYELEKAIEEAGKYDSKILVEEGIKGKEVECAILQKEELIASHVGEIKSADKFYSYNAKYIMNDSKTLIPADIDEKQSKEIKKQAIKAFKAIDAQGLSRVDFFIEDETGEIYINEINTFPGFTKISMYPKLFEASGISYSELIDILIQNVTNK